MSEWIKCSDRYPKDREKVIIYDKYFQSHEMAFYYENPTTEYIWFYPENNGWKKEEIDYWMKLPEPPGE